MTGIREHAIGVGPAPRGGGFGALLHFLDLPAPTEFNANFVYGIHVFHPGVVRYYAGLLVGL